MNNIFKLYNEYPRYDFRLKDNMDRISDHRKYMHSGRKYCPKCGTYHWYTPSIEKADFCRLLLKQDYVEDSIDIMFDNQNSIESYVAVTLSERKHFASEGELLYACNYKLLEKRGFKLDEKAEQDFYFDVFAETEYLPVKGYRPENNSRFWTKPAISCNVEYSLLVRYRLQELNKNKRHIVVSDPDYINRCPVCENDWLIDATCDKEIREDQRYQYWIGPDCSILYIDTADLIDLAEKEDVLLEKKQIIKEAGAVIVPTLAVGNSQVSLKEFIGHLYNTECNIRFFEETLENVLYLKNANDRECLFLERELESELRNGIEESISQISKRRIEINDKYRSNDIKGDLEDYLIANGVIKPEMPQKPSEPEMEKTVQPNLQKSNLFNQKKIRMQYEEELEKYNEIIQQNDLAMREYKKRLEEYEKQLIKYSEDIQKYNDERMVLGKEFSERKQIEKEDFESKRNEEMKFLDEEMVSLNNRLSNLKQYAQEVFESRSEYIQRSFLGNELEEIRYNLKELYGCKKQLLSLGILYPKYCDLVALSSIYEYLISGRCDKLEGPYGAYNIYENECISHTIISKLDDIIDSLETIKQNQYMLYMRLGEITDSISQLESGLEKSLKSLDNNSKKALGHLENIENNSAAITNKLDKISNNIAVSAYYNMKTAEYTKRTAELTDALGFLVAFK